MVKYTEQLQGVSGHWLVLTLSSFVFTLPAAASRFSLLDTYFPSRHWAEHLHKQLLSQLVAFHRLFPSFLHSPTLETEHACSPDSPVSSYLPTCPSALGMLVGDFFLFLHFSLLDTYFPSFSDNCIGSHCCNESFFHHTLLQLPQLNADGI